MDELREVLNELKELMRDSSRSKPYDDRSAGYAEGYADALTEVYDIVMLYLEDDDDT